jgi:radical SAM superfamily enzyme YgiQ (UPF0313 family)
MDGVFVTAPFSFHRRTAPCTPLGLISLATVLTRSGMDVAIHDVNVPQCDLDWLDPSVIAKRVLVSNPRFLGFTTVCASYGWSLGIAEACKALAPRVPIIFGGPQATVTAEETLRMYRCVDYVLCGEAERTIVPLAEALCQGGSIEDLPGLTFRRGASIVQNKEAPLIENLDELPQPDYHLFPSMDIVDTIFFEDGRGCPFQCSYCSTNRFWRRKFRTKSVSRLGDLLEKLVADYGVERNFVSVHDTPFLSNERIMSFCAELDRRHLRIHWKCYARVEYLNEKTISRMAATGCASVFIGIESGSSRIQKVIRKNLALDRVVPVSCLLGHYGIKHTASFILGFPEETLDDIAESIKLMMTLRYRPGELQDIQCHRLTPLKGSRMHDQYRDKLQYDGSFWGPWAPPSSRLSWQSRDSESNRDVFPSQWYYPMRHVPRPSLLKIHFFVNQLLFLPYSTFLLFKQDHLRFPALFLEHINNLKLPENYERKFGSDEAMSSMEQFILLTLSGHQLPLLALAETLRYECALTHLSSTLLSEPGSQYIRMLRFETDIEAFLKEIDSLRWTGVPAIVKEGPVTLLFTHQNRRPVTLRVPESIAAILEEEENLPPPLDPKESLSSPCEIHHAPLQSS